MPTKHQQLHALTVKRKTSCWHGYHQIGDFHDGAYESDHVSPYTISAGNPDADVFILLQDWASADGLAGPIDQETVEFGHTPSLPTNRNLVRLLNTHFGLTLADTYATNLFPFIKPGGMSATIPVRDLVKAAREFALPQIAIVQPRLVVCLGLQTFCAMQRATGRRPAANLAEAIGSPLEVESAMIWCQAHTGGLGQANRNRGGVDRVSSDWATMSHTLNGDRSSRRHRSTRTPQASESA
ncbi:MAG: hypothetical protein WD534_09985 [Phycisphaeraceae bacterium]